MTELLTDGSVEDPALADHAKLKAVLCGSFRRDPEGLGSALSDLRDAADVLSPRSLDFIDAEATFVRLPDEVGESVQQIEDRHLRAIVDADFVWLHCPDGYVGSSAALEVGHARALGIPVYASHRPADDTLGAYVRVVPDPKAAAATLVSNPGDGLRALQSYYARAAARRGWGEETPADTMLLLTEELGELAREVRRAKGLDRHHPYDGQLSHELADVQLYLLHLATALGIDLAAAVTDKETINAARFERRQERVVA